MHIPEIFLKVSGMKHSLKFSGPTTYRTKEQTVLHPVTMLQCLQSCIFFF